MTSIGWWYFLLVSANALYCVLIKQWLCNADKSCHEPRLSLKAFFGSLYRCLARGARAVLQVYPESLAQRELILGFAMRAGFAGGVVVDYPHRYAEFNAEMLMMLVLVIGNPSSRKRKEYLVLTCGPPSLTTATPKAKGEDEESCSEDESSRDEENQTVSAYAIPSYPLLFQQPIISVGNKPSTVQVCISDRHRPRKKQRITKKGKGRDWVLKKKEQMRKKGNHVPPDTKYTARKRKARF
ncbi:hypothetical protein RHGRI_034713 [Rhododendron griersonianum]|uniref:18S rRNA (guanine(1575)-N(7))-methyltransferase Bud23 C-terminal domain-containing protein n=1 Tax=Rhododendron griersonianum TaxID=479676 RepID=A0AAV6I259_9ERIC|nr:hypothetical protein RHGRI_034713 [Rhododendron griersonianum]